MKGFIFSLLLTATLVRAAPTDLAGRVDAVISRPSQKNVTFAVSILQARTGRAVYSHNPTKPMIPASNMKLIVTAAAFKYLGADFQYETKVALINDTLVVTGAGDPLLADKVTDRKNGRETGWVLDDIAAALKQNNITHINDIIVDSSIFDDQRVHPSWPKAELNRWYACEVAGLNYNGNCVEVTAETVAGKVKLTLEPQTRYVSIINKCRPATRPPDTVWCARALGTNDITVFGRCHKKCRPVRVAVERPAAFFGYLLAERLAAAGIAVRGRFLEQKIKPDEQFKVLLTFRTTLPDVAARCNKDSFGLAAEALLKTIAAYSKKTGSWQQGREIISQYLSALNIPADQYNIDDASGLSRADKLTTNAVTTVLLDVYNSPYRQTYKDTLAVGGLDGTLKKHFKQDKYKAHIFGKTGYINSVKSFSGLCTTSKGDYIFSILTNRANGKTRAAINDIVKATIDSE